jgi:hypothetical protein
MPKLVVLISKRPEISRDDFIAYYEANHAPLAKRLLPMIGRYTRSFLPEGHGADFDVVTEIWFADDAAYAEFRTRMADPVIIAAIRADEANFLLSDRVRSWLVLEAGDAPGTV